MAELFRSPDAILSPNFGLYFNRSDLLVPRRGLIDGLNFRIKDGKLNNFNLGWTKFGQWTLNGRVMAIYKHQDRNNPDTLFFATPTDIYQYSTALSTVFYMTPRYDTGTVSVATTTATGAGTLWLANVKAGDQIMFGAAGYNGLNPSGNDAFTRMLLHFDGADASTTFTDYGSAGSSHVWTAVGNAQVDTAQSVFGGASLLLDGTGDWLTTPDDLDFFLFNFDWTFNIRFRVGGGDGTQIFIMSQSDAGLTAAGTSFIVFRNAAGQIQASLSNGSAFTVLQSSLLYTTISNPGWHDLEYSRSGNTLYLFIDGVLAASTAFSGNVPNSAAVFSIGSLSATSGSWFGWLDEFRFSLGVGRHTANFTPATEAFYTQWFTINNVATNISLTFNTGVASAISATSPYTIRRTYQTSSANQWQFTSFVRDSVSGKDIMFATNFADWVQTWSYGDTQMTSQSGLGFKAKALLPFSNMMIYADLVDAATKPASMINSDIGKPLVAGSLGAGLSEEFVVHDQKEGIDSLGHLANSLILYSKTNITAAQFVGAPEVFVFREIDRDIGPVGAFAVADFGDYHEFLGPDGAYRFDGVGATEVHAHVMRHVRAQIDPARAVFTYTYFLDPDGEVIWSVPGNSDPNAGALTAPPVIGWTEHYLEDVGPSTPRPFSKRQFPFTATGSWIVTTGTTWASLTLPWSSYTGTWADFQSSSSIQNLAGDANGQIWILNTSQYANGVGLASYVTFARFAVGDMHEKNVLQRWYPYTTEGTGNLTVTTLYSNFATKAMLQDSGLAFDMSMAGDNDFVSPMRKARYVAPQFGTSGDGYQIEGYNYEFLGVHGGRR